MQPEAPEEQDILECLEHLEHLETLVDRAFRERQDYPDLRVRRDLPAGPVQQASPVQKDSKARPECKVPLVGTVSLDKLEAKDYLALVGLKASPATTAYLALQDQKD